MSRFDFRTRTGQISPIIEGVSSIDADAQAFFNRVTAAGGTLTQTEKDAVNALTLSLKINNLWTLMKVIYPMVGGSAASCAQNLKSTFFTGTFTSGWTFSNLGITGNGTSTYMETNFIQNSSWTSTSNSSMGIVSATNATATNYRIDMGSVVLNNFLGGGSCIGTGTLFFSSINGVDTVSGDSQTSTIGFFVASRTISTEHRRYKRGSSTINRTLVNSIPADINRSIIIGAGRDQDGISLYTAKRYNFAFFGDGITQAQVDTYWTILQTFNTTLGR